MAFIYNLIARNPREESRLNFTCDVTINASLISKSGCYHQTANEQKRLGLQLPARTNHVLVFPHRRQGTSMFVAEEMHFRALFSRFLGIEWHISRREKLKNRSLLLLHHCINSAWSALSSVRVIPAIFLFLLLIIRLSRMRYISYAKVTARAIRQVFSDHGLNTVIVITTFALKRLFSC